MAEGWLRALGWPLIERCDIVLALNEAVTNVIEHAYQNDTGRPVRLILRERRDYGRRRVDAVVADCGLWKPASVPDPTPQTGLSSCMCTLRIDAASSGPWSPDSRAITARSDGPLFVPAEWS